jgi:hypothetical protein
LYYFTFTTLSTVGFGDFNPKSNIERLFFAFGMLFGVAIFSIIMGNFITMLNEMKDFTHDFEEGESLAKFFGILKAFNRGEFINVELKDKIEKYFDYRWVNHMNYFLTNDEFETFFGQLPDEVIDAIYLRFLFGPFMKVYTPIFEFKKNSNLHSRYVWDDPPYRSFMLAILKNLEPRREEANSFLFEELDEFNEVIFFMSGSY